jgi:outer membrane biosynthesis protein TonB
VRNAFAVRSSNPEFIKPALDSVNQWKFSPGKVAGKDVNTHMQVPIVFTMTADAPAQKS